jgi:hypothetical protein
MISRFGVRGNSVFGWGFNLANLELISRIARMLSAVGASPLPSEERSLRGEVGPQDRLRGSRVLKR